MIATKSIDALSLKLLYPRPESWNENP